VHIVHNLVQRPNSLALVEDKPFSAPGNFSRFLKEHTGVTPSTFRRAASGATPSTVTALAA
jgi:hypothetical protein